MDLIADKFDKERLLGCICKVATRLDESGRFVQQGTFNDIAYGEVDGSDSERVAMLQPACGVIRIGTSPAFKQLARRVV